MGIRRELTLRLPNSPGALAGVCGVLADERVTIAAMALTVGGQLHLIVDNHIRAVGALRERHHTVTERDVLFVATSGEPGGFASVLALVSAAAVNVEYAYSGTDSRAGAAVVMGVDDALHASAMAGV